MIAGVAVPQLAYKGTPVVTFAMVDEVHQRPSGTAKRNFDENRVRFLEADDFIEVGSDEIRTNLPEGVFSKFAPKGYLRTKLGYLKLTKPMNDDRAWQVQDEMVDRYFAVEAARSMTPAELLFEQARMLLAVERTQAEHATRISAAEHRLDQIETASHHFTCIGHASCEKHKPIDLKTASELGRRASKRCRDMGIPISKIPDPRFGVMNQFPKAILDEVWEEMFGE